MVLNLNNYFRFSSLFRAGTWLYSFSNEQSLCCNASFIKIGNAPLWAGAN